MKSSKDLDTKQPSYNGIPGKNNRISATEQGNKSINGKVIKKPDVTQYVDDIMKTVETKGVCDLDQIFPKGGTKLLTSQYFLNLLILLNENKLQLTLINNQIKLSLIS